MCNKLLLETMDSAIEWTSTLAHNLIIKFIARHEFNKINDFADKGLLKERFLTIFLNQLLKNYCFKCLFDSQL